MKKKVARLLRKSNEFICKVLIQTSYLTFL
jgi:hypothetical protein